MERLDMSEHTPRNSANQSKKEAVARAPRTASAPVDSGRHTGDIKYEKRKKAHTGCLTGVLYVVLIIAVSFGLAVFAWTCANDVLALVKDEAEVKITVREDSTVSEISRELEEKKIINFAWLFNLYCKLTDVQVGNAPVVSPTPKPSPTPTPKPGTSPAPSPSPSPAKKSPKYINPGTYTLSSMDDYRALVYAMKKGSEQAEVVNGVTIREGLTLKQTLEILVEKRVSTMEELLDAVENYDFTNEFVKDLPKSPGRLEGYLYPDTYDFFVDEDPHKALNKLLSNFSRKLTSDFRKRIEDMDYSMQEIIIIASMIEMESRDDMDDKKNIASVIYNRLEKWEVPLLQIDATIQYFLPERVPRVLNEHLAIDNPYNTYMYPGLPPGPICSPSIDSIRAALYPYSTKYNYYAMTDDGTHAFCSTLPELEKIKKNNPKTYGP